MPPTRTTPPSEAETDKAGPPVAATHLPRTTSVRYSLGRILDCARQRSPLSGGQGEQR